MATTRRSGADGTGFMLGRNRIAGEKLTANTYPQTVLLVNDGSLASAITVAANTAYIYPSAVTVEVSSVVNGSSIVLVGTDTNGDALSETLSWATGDPEAKTTTGIFATLTTATPSGFTSETADISVEQAGMIRKLFPVIELGVAEQSENVENNLISTLGAAVESQVGSLSAGGTIRTAALIEDTVHFVRGALNPDSVTSTALSDQDDVVTSQSIGTAYTTALTATWPSQVQIVFSSTPTSGGTVTVTGYRRTGSSDFDNIVQEERIPIDTTGATFTSSKYFHQITSITVTGVEPSTLTYNVSLLPKTFRTQMAFNTSNQAFPGWTGMFLVGNVPAVCQELELGSLGISASEDGIEISLEMLGSRYDFYRTIAGGDTKQIELSAADLTFYPKASDRRYTGRLGIFQYNNAAVDYTNLDVNINLNRTPNPGIRGTRWRRGTIRGGNRSIEIIPTTFFEAPELATDTYNDWQEVFRNETRTALLSQFYAFTAFGRQDRMDISAPSAKITSSPQFSVGDSGPISNPIPFEALTTTATPSEIVFTFYTPAAYTE